MRIQNMFRDDINRKINGVIQVTQQDETTEREIKEYIITREIKGHFMTFFNNYGEAFNEPTNNIGVWISGFFGSGKSHFLKMLSYILENKVINGVSTVERFREKFEDDPATFMLVDQATRNETETILFNIDEEGFSDKNETVVKRIFAKMFYNHLGFYGEDLKVARLEQFIEKQGKTEAFRRAFEERNGESWIDTRSSFEFFEDDVVPTLVEVLGMSQQAAENWFNSSEKAEISTTQLVSEIKEYVDRKPDNFRLIFMADEVGQYIGTHRDLLLDLQSIVESLGRECRGKVWVICTGQEALDEIIKVRMDAFSTIQARFSTRLSLSSSAVDEVIQKRLLKKTPDAETMLTSVYDRNDIVLKNLFSFKDSRLDMKGFANEFEFVENYPFVPYQFLLVQRIFSEVRKHGGVGEHYSGAERSMLDGFQIVAKAVQDKDENAIAPLYPFYDSIHTFLDGSIRRVIERCARAAENGDGIEAYDVDVLKLLYLIRYVDDIPANLENIVVLMADNIFVDKVKMRKEMQKSLDRLMGQNYIGRTGDVYNFLTDEEQEIQRDIMEHTHVDTADIVTKIGEIIFGDIFATKKYRRGKDDFSFDQMVDGIIIGKLTGGMRLRFLTVATDAEDKAELHLMAESKGSDAIVVLGDTPYYKSLENAMKIRAYVNQRNVAQLSKSVQIIIQNYMEEADRCEKDTREQLERAIEIAEFYVDGEHLPIKSGDAKSKINQALEYLVTHVYYDLDLIEKNVESDADIIAILTGSNQVIAGMEPNRSAAAKIEEYLEMQYKSKLPTSMADILTRYRAKPYGWKEIDIAAVVARLIVDQKVTVKYAGTTIQPDNPKLPDMLRRQSETGKTSISKRQMITATKMRSAKELLRELFDVMDVPNDEDGLVAFVIDHFTELKAHYEDLCKRYEGHHYPDKEVVVKAIQQLEKVLSQKKDNIALIDEVLQNEDPLFDNKEAMQRVEGFFKNQVQVFDTAVKMEADLMNDLSYLANEPEADQALNQIRLITKIQTDSKTIYRRIPELNALMNTVRDGHNRLLDAKRNDVLEIITQCMGKIHGASEADVHYRDVVSKADHFYDEEKKRCAQIQQIALLNGMIPNLWQYCDDTCILIETMKQPVTPPQPKPASPHDTPAPKPVKKNVKQVYRQMAFPAKQLRSQRDIDAYVEYARDYLTMMLKDCDELTLK